MKQITKGDKMILSYKTITFHYPLSNIEIDFNGKNVFKVFTIDNNGNRDKQPLEILREPLMTNKNDINLAQLFCDNWIKTELYKI
jgi:hypothetical protein